MIIISTISTCADSWVYGKAGAREAGRERQQRLEGRIRGGAVTRFGTLCMKRYLRLYMKKFACSTVLYCWVAAITTKAGEFVCTGTLVAEDLVVTSGSCINL